MGWQTISLQYLFALTSQILNQGLSFNSKRSIKKSTSGSHKWLRCESEPVEPEPVKTGGGKVWNIPFSDPVRRYGE